MAKKPNKSKAYNQAKVEKIDSLLNEIDEQLYELGKTGIKKTSPRIIELMNRFEVYMGYRDIFTGKLPIKERPEAVAKKAEKAGVALAEKAAADLADALLKKEKADLETLKKQAAEDKAIRAERIEAQKAELARLEAEEAAILEKAEAKGINVSKPKIIIEEPDEETPEEI